MIKYRCDGCQRDLRRDGSDHFVLKIETFAAAGALEFSKEDLEKDHRAEMQSIMRDLARSTPDDIEDQVYRSFRFDLCPTCHRHYLKQPLQISSQP